MKFLMFALIAISTITAHAATSIEHGYKSILRDIPIRNACITANEVQSIKPIKTCVQLQPADVLIPDRPNMTPSWKCQLFADVKLVYPRRILTESCTKYAPVRSAESYPIPECLETESKVLVLPRTIDITLTTYDDLGPTPSIVAKSFTFPICK